MKAHPLVTIVILVALSALAILSSAQGQEPAAGGAWPQRVLITNDNGIEDVKIHELARAFSRVAETWVVAADRDRSGTSNLMPSVRAEEVRVQQMDIGDEVHAFAVDGYPADCIVFALAGPMRQTLPDLVVSGINGGENLGDDWFGSGTIGAARTAAYFGLPSIAVSGLNDSDPDAVATAVEWVVRLAQSDVVRSLEPPQYLTVSLPRVHPSQITGVELVERARGLIDGAATLVEQGPDGRQTWKYALTRNNAGAPQASDVAAVLSRSAIAIVPMRADESDPTALAKLAARPELVPTWSFDPSKSVAPRCPSGLGIVFDDAEEPSGREWGVVIEEVMEGGRAQEHGIRVGDVITHLNGQELEVPRRSPEDPDDRFLRLLRELDCGDELRMSIVRGDESLEVGYRIRDVRPTPPE